MYRSHRYQTPPPRGIIDRVFEEVSPVLRYLCLFVTLVLPPPISILLIPSLATAQPANDECAGAEAAPFTGAGTIAIDNTTATTSADPINDAGCAGTVIGTCESEVWYTWTPDTDGIVQVSTCNIVTFDTDIFVYTGACGALTEVACNGDDAGCAGFSSITPIFDVTAGTTYTVRVGGWDASSVGTGELLVDYNCVIPVSGLICTPDQSTGTNAVLIEWTEDVFYDNITIYLDEALPTNIITTVAGSGAGAASSFNYTPAADGGHAILVVGDSGGCIAWAIQCAYFFTDPCPTTSGTTLVPVPSNQPFGQAVSCNAGGLHADNMYYRAYALCENYGVFYNIDVKCVTTVLISNPGATTQPVRVRLNIDNNGGAVGPLAGMVMFYEEEFQVPVVSNELYNFVLGTGIVDPDGVLAGSATTVVGCLDGETLVVEIFTPDGQAAGHSLFMGIPNPAQTNPATDQIGSSYILAPLCGLTSPIDMVNLGFPTNMWIMDVAWDDAGFCCGGDDLDGDGIPNECDIDQTPGPDCDTNGVLDACQPDSDSDGTIDPCDSDVDGDGIPNDCDSDQTTGLDCDGNGALDSCDLNNGAPDCDLNGELDVCQPDTDSDGTIDPCDDDLDGDGIPNDCDIDQTTGLDCDGNGALDSCDLNNGAPDCDLNGELDVCQPDTDSDGTIDPCDDDLDGDGIPNDCDIDQTTGLDCDGNGALDSCDLNNGAPDCNTNGIPDSCDPDCDSNGFPDECDLAGGAPDCNANGIPDSCDPDCDSNGIPDDSDLAGGAPDCDANGQLDVCQPDSDSDGTIDPCDDDIDGDGIPNECDVDQATGGDCNTNGVLDECDITNGTSPDCNGNNIPDECEYSSALDCNSNGILDECDILLGLSEDCNTNGIPDECEEDCNGNGIPDDCEILDKDCNGNGVIDDCEIENGTVADCNSNSLPDICEYSPETDCNTNGILDECDILVGISEDCNGNNTPDECDIAAGSPDENGDGVPDSCDGDLFIRGECNGDASIDLGDGIFLLAFLFTGGPASTCQDASDINDDGGIDIVDATALLFYLFTAGYVPPAPFPDCGIDPTFDALDCVSFGACP